MIHVVGAGLAGLAAAVALVGAGREVVVYEAGPAAGGRCRSYFDRALGCRIDNGNHLLLSGNLATMGFLETIGARGSLGGPGAPVFPFYEMKTGLRWVLRPGLGRLPWWVFSQTRRVPGTRAWDYWQVLGLRRGGTVAEGLRPDSVLYRRLLEPLAVAALNTPAEAGLASLLRPVMAETLLRGGRFCVPLVPRVGLSESFIDPAVAWLAARGAAVLTGRRIGGMAVAGDRVTGLAGGEAVAPGDQVVLAVPAPVAAGLVPGLVVPEAFEAIVNVHFRVAADPGEAGFFGVVGGVAEWIFVRHGIVSVTVSAANRLVEREAEEIAAMVWADVRAVLGLGEAMPAVRVVKERRATFAATAAQERRRPGPRTAVEGLVLAGDWTATGLPATIEGAIRSGRAAAEVLLAA